MQNSENPKCSVYIIDDHVVIRDGLKSVLQRVEDISVVGMSGNPEKAIQDLSSLSVDVVIVDYDLKTARGDDAIKKIKGHYPQLHFLALTSYDEKGVIRSMVKAGAISFVLKDADLMELVEAIRTTARGESWFSQDISKILLGDVLSSDSSSAHQSSFNCDPSSLTEREKDVLRLIVNEKTNREIADDLHISVKTVENHRSNLLQKIGARNTAGLVRYAMTHSLA
jgi:DNA-binding NarL/FixJ family response regulator